MNLHIPKYVLLIAGVIAVLAVGVTVGSLLGADDISTSSAAQAAVPFVQTQEMSATSSSGHSYEDTVKVIRVIDGDTIEIEGGEVIRYIGIDTPETVDPRKPVQCFGIEASKRNKALVEGKTVRLERDITDKDRYGRSLRYVWVDNTLINLELVRQGFAHSFSYPPDIKYQDSFVSAEGEAREAKRGLWTACRGVNTPPTPIAADAANASGGEGECTIKGNINASGEKIYHLPGCGSYSKTTIEASRGERWFCSESEAQSAGWRRALNCN